MALSIRNLASGMLTLLLFGPAAIAAPGEGRGATTPPAVLHAVRSPADTTGTLSGTVTDFSGSPLAGVTVRIVNTAVPAAQTDGSGYYAISGVPAGAGYSAVFGLLPTYGGASASFTIRAGQVTIEDAALPSAETFEEGSGAYTGDYPWQWGTPSGPGPGGAYSGTKCWGTNLTGNYPDNTTAYLTSHVIDPTGLPFLSLSFTHYYDTQAGFDGGNVQVSNGQGWITVTPVGGYPSANVPGLGGEPGWSGSSGGWQPAVFDLTPYSHSHLTIRFHFGSDGSINGPGWYIDDVAIFVYGDPSSGVAHAVPPPASIRLLPARPNPFHDEAVIRFQAPATAAAALLRIVDSEGRTVRNLYQGPASEGEQAVPWDGRDQSGRIVPAGIYYSFLAAEGRIVSGGPIVRLR